jgi:hypothetical protein
VSEIEWSDFREASRILKQERHAEWHAQNMAILRSEPNLSWRSTNGGESLLIRQPGMPKVDFYPSTGRWRVAGVRETFGGGAVKFLEWYRSQKGKK